MKGGFYGIRGKQISLTLIALVCATLVIWAWDKTSLLATFVPPHSQLLKPSQEIIMDSIDSKLDVPVKEDLADAPKRFEKENKDLVDSAAENPPDKISPTEQKGVLLNSPEDLKGPQQNRNGGTGIEPVKGTPDLGTPVGSEITTTYKTEKGENIAIKPEDKKETSLGSSGEQKKAKQGLNEERLEPVEKTPDAGKQVGSETAAPPDTQKYKNSTTYHEEKKACNYGKGKWVEDSTRPLYSGFECKRWLSAMWACRLTQRTDFAYERFRWHPNDCEMPNFEGSLFLKRMQDKTIAIVGDSLGRQQFQSLMCMASGGKERPDVLDVGWEYGLVKAHGATRPDGWVYRFPETNTTILYYWSASLSDLEPIDINNPATDWAMHLDRPPAFLSRNLHRFDVLVLNTGHHWNRGKLRANRWVMYVGGVPNTDRKIAEIGGAKNFTIYSVVKWLDSQLPKHPKLKAFFRTISPRHFFHGDWDSGGSCDNTTPLAGGKEVVKDESSDPIASGAVKGTQVKLLDVTALSELRDEGHISRYSIKATPGVQDCLHWCLPGVPDTWNELLFAQI